MSYDLSAQAEGTRKKKQGRRDELILTEYLRRKQPTSTFTASTEYEDIHHDVDIYVNQRPVSIKCYNPTTPQNFLFELERQDVGDRWHDSWYRTGRAEWYIVWHKGMNMVFALEKKDVVAYEQQRLAQGKPAFDMIKQLSTWVRQEQQEINHRDRDVRNGLVPIDLMRRLGIAKKVGTLNPDQAQEIERHLRQQGVLA